MPDYSHKKFEINILADRIFKLKPFEGVELDVEDIKEMRKVYLEFSRGKSFAILLDATDNFTPTEEARKLLASEDYTRHRFGAALVTPTLASRIIGNFFIQFNKPATPTKLFNDEATAFQWLQEQKIEHDKGAI